MRNKTLKKPIVALVALSLSTPAWADHPYLAIEAGSAVAKSNDVDETVVLSATPGPVAQPPKYDDVFKTRNKRGTDLGLGIGIDAGYATLGRIGFEGRYDYGALGPVTNLASRLSTRAASGQILIGARVFAAVEEQIDAAPVGELELKGFGRPMSAYEVRGLR